MEFAESALANNALVLNDSEFHGRALKVCYTRCWDPGRISNNATRSSLSGPTYQACSVVVVAAAVEVPWEASAVVEVEVATEEVAAALVDHQGGMLHEGKFSCKISRLQA